MDAVVGHSIVNFFDPSKSGGATALPAPMVVTPLDSSSSLLVKDK